ncbi:hypothetical protein CYMTET_53439, partial [Cymbomonas tetramitiformis]
AGAVAIVIVNTGDNNMVIGGVDPEVHIPVIGVKDRTAFDEFLRDHYTDPLPLDARLLLHHIPLGCIGLGEALPQSKALRVLDLRSAGVAPDGVARLATGLAASRTLTSLCLSGNPIQDAGLSALSAALAKDPGVPLQHLGLSGCKLGSPGMHAVRAILATSAALRSIDLSKNSITMDFRWQVTVQDPRSGTPVELDGLTWTVMPGSITKAATRLLTGTVNLHRSDLRGVEALAEALVGNAVLENLDLRGCALGVEGMRALGPCLARSRALTSLRLGKNELGTEGSAACAAVLTAKEGSGLRALEFAANELGAEGPSATMPFVEALSLNTSLTALDLSWNALNSCERKTCPQPETSHDVGDEKLDTEQHKKPLIEHVAQALSSNTMLTQCDFSRNMISDATLAGICQMLRRRTLRELDLRGNAITRAGAQMLHDVVKEDDHAANAEIPYIATKLLGVDQLL